MDPCINERIGSRCPGKELIEVDRRCGCPIGTASCAGGEPEVSAESGRGSSTGGVDMLEARLLHGEKPGMGEDMEGG